MLADEQAESLPEQIRSHDRAIEIDEERLVRSDRGGFQISSGSSLSHIANPLGSCHRTFSRSPGLNFLCALIALSPALALAYRLTIA